MPFLAVLYSTEFETIVIWDDDHETFIGRLFTTLETLSGAFTIYAHNGGKFDFMFLVHKLRGSVSFKGRGIMRCTIGAHELRDSFHIIPEKLASYKKDDFDYSLLSRKRRNNFRETIIAYCISDCVYLLELVRKFLSRFGFKISIGAAAIAKVNEHYRVERISPMLDTRVREYYTGGRVECLAGAGYWKGEYKLYDVNGMYPHAMASFPHPIGSDYVFRDGKPNINTVFLELECNNYGALLTWDDDGNLSTGNAFGTFKCSKWEYEAALELGLIDNVRILGCVDNFERTTFAKFVKPLYDERAIEKERIKTLQKGTIEYDECKAEILFLKLILNNAYGKFAQNPRRFKDYWITNPGERAPDDENGAYPNLDFEGADYWIWSRPTPKLRFLNVGTAASITGAARSILMRAIHAAKNPLYCDTDSLICEELRGVKIHDSELGAWSVDNEISELIVAGKKLYAFKSKTGEIIVKSKGAAGLTWDEMLEVLYDRLISPVIARGPTLTRRGTQTYITRQIRRTAKFLHERKA